MLRLTTASVWKTGSESSVSEMGAWRSLHIIPGGLLSILATESYDIPTIPWLMEIPASVLLPQAGWPTASLHRLKRGGECGRSQLLEEVQRKKS